MGLGDGKTIAAVHDRTRNTVKAFMFALAAVGWNH
jgi:hypothetical protein